MKYSFISMHEKLNIVSRQRIRNCTRRAGLSLTRRVAGSSAMASDQLAPPSTYNAASGKKRGCSSYCSNGLKETFTRHVKQCVDNNRRVVAELRNDRPD